jgi:hypothetical protein
LGQTGIPVGPGWAVRLETMRKDQGKDSPGPVVGPPIYVALPSALDFHHGRLSQTNGVALLLALRDRVVDRLTGYTFSPKTNKREYHSLMMLGRSLA